MSYAKKIIMKRRTFIRDVSIVATGASVLPSALWQYGFKTKP
jgi:hypothetical protein